MGMNGILINQAVEDLRVAQAVVIDLVAFVARRKIVTILRSVVPAVKKTLAEPCQARHFQPLQMVL